MVSIGKDLSNVSDNYEKAIKFIIDYVKEHDVRDPTEVNRIKNMAVRMFKLNKVPSNTEILRFVKEDSVKNIFRLKPVRSISGVVIVAIMTSPFECPHGRCLYCPHYPGAPISYTGKEPSAMRGIHNNFDPYKQITSRLNQLRLMGHAIDKVEIIIQGGTFNMTSIQYKEWYMRRLLEAFIGYYPNNYLEGLADAEKSDRRIVGITFETRPDACKEEDIDWMLERGGTRVELGVQTIYDDVYKLVNRGHLIKDVVESTRRLKDAGFKVTYHLMPGLPKVDAGYDLICFEKIFSSSCYIPDNLKIYPTLVLENTGLLEYWKRGLYVPYDTEDAATLISIAKGNFIPKWVRIMRINRDIPSYEVVDGVKKTNLRQIVLRDIRSLGLRCRCIRCRESGHAVLKGVYHSLGELEIVLSQYYANEGMEFFIAVEDIDHDIIFGFIRVRKPSNKVWRSELSSEETCLVRELHVYGQSLPIGEKKPYKWGSWQHIGLGSVLLKTAENLTSSLGGDKLAIISGVGVREYYYKHGYKIDGPYVSKRLL